MAARGDGAYWSFFARMCDACGGAARLFCGVHGAYLCVPCDGQAHGAAAARHGRVWLCEVCEHAPAAVTCKADAAALCAACDSDIHSANPLSQRHERVPVVPFVGAAAPSAAAAAGPFPEEEDARSEAEAASWLLPEPVKNVSGGIDVDDDGAAHSESNRECTIPLFQESRLLLDLDYGRSSMDGVVKAAGAPPPPPLLDQKLFFPVCSPLNNSVSSSEAAVVPEAEAAGTAAAAATTAPVPVKGKEREARLIRYREKRKSRRFEKTIRYASRKAYAESRPRIKGRFAKRAGGDDADDGGHAGEMFSVAAFMSVDPDYGVVPTF